MIRYEHPLNERVRTLMRLEDLFARAGYFAAQDAATSLPTREERRAATEALAKVQVTG